jgi:hypothetical protein
MNQVPSCRVWCRWSFAVSTRAASAVYSQPNSLSTPTPRPRVTSRIFFIPLGFGFYGTSWYFRRKRQTRANRTPPPHSFETDPTCVGHRERLATVYPGPVQGKLLQVGNPAIPGGGPHWPPRAEPVARPAQHTIALFFSCSRHGSPQLCLGREWHLEHCLQVGTTNFNRHAHVPEIGRAAAAGTVSP